MTVMLHIRQYPYAKDNLGYLVYGQTRAMAIDGGASREILSFLKEKELLLEYVTNTHSHPDHTVGNQVLTEKTGARFLGFDALMAEGAIELENEYISVIHTPGHTQDSVCFFFDGVLVSGDTLFNGKVGRCFTGDYPGFLQSIKKLLALPGATRICAGHDYVREYMAFARALEPDNPHIDSYLAKYDPNHLCYTLDEEILVNPYLRINEEKIAAIIKSRNLPGDTEYDRWHSLLSLM